MPVSVFLGLDLDHHHPVDPMKMADQYIPGGLYIAGFTQARSPHIGLLLAKSPDEGTLFYIRIDTATSPNWQFQRRSQPVKGDMFLSSLLSIRQESLAPLETCTESTLEAIAKEVAVPDNADFGECAPWALNLVELLHEKGVVELMDKEKLAEEVDAFSKESRAFARRDKFPNVAASKFCR